MNREQAFQFCDRWLQAWSGNQPERLAEFYAPDVYYQDPSKPAGLRGRDAFLSYARKLLVKFPVWQWKAMEIFPQDAGFLLKWEARVAPESPPFYGLDIVEIRDGLISRNEVYFDSRELRPAGN